MTTDVSSDGGSHVQSEKEMFQLQGLCTRNVLLSASTSTPADARAPQLCDRTTRKVQFNVTDVTCMTGHFHQLYYPELRERGLVVRSMVNGFKH